MDHSWFSCSKVQVSLVSFCWVQICCSAVSRKAQFTESIYFASVCIFPHGTHLYGWIFVHKLFLICYKPFFSSFFFINIILKISENLMSMMDEENSLWMLVECLSERNSQKRMRELETNWTKYYWSILLYTTVVTINEGISTLYNLYIMSMYRRKISKTL